MAQIPPTMRALAIPSFGKPSSYGLASVPTPEITQPDEVLIKIHAAGVNPIDVKVAEGALKMAHKYTFPLVLGHDASGTIVAVGTGVDGLKVGDQVFTRVPSHLGGTVAEYCLSTVSATALKPESMSFVDAASIPLVGLTVLQVIQRAEAELGGLKGKTVYVPGGLSGTGNVAVQLLKNVFGVKKVITTLSTGKIERAKELFQGGKGEIVYIDYTEENVNSAIGAGTIDFMFDTMAGAIDSLPLIRSGGVIVTISKTPSGDELKKKFASTPWFLVALLNLVDQVNKWRAGRYGVSYSYLWMNPDAKGLDDLARWAGEGKFKPLVGRTAKLEDIDAVKGGYEEVYQAKGGVGKSYTSSKTSTATDPKPTNSFETLMNIAPALKSTMSKSLNHAKITARRSAARGHGNHGWLDSHHTFSFASYYDPKFESFGSLRVLNEDRVAAHNGFPTHPHRDAEIFSYILSGELTHRDSTIQKGKEVKEGDDFYRMKRGDVQFTTGGTGIAHSENNESDKPVHFLQIWALPWARGLTPRYHTKTFDEAAKREAFVPILSPLAAGKGASAEEEAAAVPALAGTIPIHADFVMAAGIIGVGKRFEWSVGGESGADSVVKSKADRKVYIHVPMTNNGKARVRLDGREDSVLGEGDGAFVTGVQAGDVLGFESIGEGEAEVIVLDSD
ncbi:hypothetical protein V493_05947 [Pseudogymnoascus sp. VKM F-4281 (FW-2241)]|nr:hypothetical protein V493_05947 [Pseudogymnoascus sp. VKM F-4281 (FW-2241)]